MNSIVVQGIEIPLKQKGCQCHPGTSLFDHQYVFINVYVTNSCNGTCKFCCNVNNTPFQFDLEKFKRFFDEVYSKIAIRKVTFTGGEPSLNFSALYDCIQYISGKCEQIVICTNGTLLQYDLVFYPSITGVSVSRHHYDEDKNEELIGLRTGDLIDLYKRELWPSIGNKINLSCNLIKGYIDSVSEMYMFLEYASKCGIHNVAFVNLLEVNDYCKEHKTHIPFIFDNRVLNYRKWEYFVPNICECSNYVYTAESGELIKFYIRNNLCRTYNMGSYIVYKNNTIQEWYK